MTQFNPGDKVCIYIPDPTDPDHRYHGKIGTVISVNIDGLGNLTDNPDDNYIYTIAFNNEDLVAMDFRHQDLKSYI
jgi:ribosomal protein L21E